MRGAAGTDELLGDGTPQVAFIGRSNVGKSSLINSLTGEDGLARTSSFPGLTQEINIYFINKSLYLLDLPGYGYAQASRDTREKIQKLIYWYLWDSPYVQKKIVLIIDANIGATKPDLEMLHSLDERNKNVIIVANKIDKIKKADYDNRLRELQELCGNHKIIPYSSVDKIDIAELTDEILL
jgi:GTP-binding protein